MDSVAKLRANDDESNEGQRVGHSWLLAGPCYFTNVPSSPMSAFCAWHELFLWQMSFSSASATTCKPVFNPNANTSVHRIGTLNRASSLLHTSWPSNKSGGQSTMLGQRIRSIPNMLMSTLGLAFQKFSIEDELDASSRHDAWCVFTTRNLSLTITLVELKLSSSRTSRNWSQKRAMLPSK